MTERDADSKHHQQHHGSGQHACGEDHIGIHVRAQGIHDEPGDQIAHDGARHDEELQVLDGLSTTIRGGEFERPARDAHRVKAHAQVAQQAAAHDEQRATQGRTQGDHDEANHTEAEEEHGALARAPGIEDASHGELARRRHDAREAEQIGDEACVEAVCGEQHRQEAVAAHAGHAYQHTGGQQQR